MVVCSECARGSAGVQRLARGPLPHGTKSACDQAIERQHAHSIRWLACANLDARDGAHGADALQALINAIQGVRKALDDSSLALTWVGGEPGDHGVPRIVPMFFGRAFARDIEDEIDWRFAAHKPPVRRDAREA
jgi:hypothetical protein